MWDFIVEMSPYYRWKIADLCVSRVRPRWSGLITREIQNLRFSICSTGPPECQSHTKSLLGTDVLKTISLWRWARTTGGKSQIFASHEWGQDCLVRLLGRSKICNFPPVVQDLPSAKIIPSLYLGPMCLVWFHYGDEFVLQVENRRFLHLTSETMIVWLSGCLLVLSGFVTREMLV